MHNGNIHHPKSKHATHNFRLQVYKPSGGWRAFLLIISVLLGGFSAVGVWYFGTMHEASSVRAAMWMVGICLAFVLLSCMLVTLLFRSRVILEPNSVESRELLSTGRLLREDILGYRLQHNPNGPASLVLVPRDASRKQLKFTTFYNFNDTFWNWIESLPNLNQEDQDTAQHEMLEDPEIGATPQDRLAAIKKTKKLATYLNVAACAVCAWGCFYPEPYKLAMVLLMILPWFAVAITMRWRSFFRIDKKKNDPHPTVAFLFLMPGCVLMLRAINDANLLEWRTMIYVTLLLMLALAATAIMADPSLKSSKGTIFAIILLTTFYGYGAGAEANMIFDRSGAAIYSTQIISKQIISGKQTSYNLYLTPWGPQQQPNKVSVPRQWYESLQPGDTICPALHEGALHIRWYTVYPCPKL